MFGINFAVAATDFTKANICSKLVILIVNIIVCDSAAKSRGKVEQEKVQNRRLDEAQN